MAHVVEYFSTGRISPYMLNAVAVMIQIPLASMASGETPDCLSDLIKEQLLVRSVICVGIPLDVCRV